MQITVSPAENIISVTVLGDLDLLGAQILAATLAELLPRRLPISVDTAGVDFMDSAAVAAVEAFVCDAQGQGIPVRITSAGPAVRRILTLTGVRSWTRSPAAFPPA
jgi:anti-anti-sigma factor